MDELEIELAEEAKPEEAGEENEIALGTVASVASDGVTITIDGDSEPGEKKYKVNASALFRAGDRVKIHKNSGTYLIEYPVGDPMSRYPIPAGGSSGQMLVKDGSNPYQVKWANASHGIPSGGSARQVLAKASASDYDVSWVSAGIPTGGSSGQVLAKTGASDYAVGWATVPTIPSGGTAGQVLTKTATGSEWAAIPTQSVSQLVNGNYTLNLSNAGVLASASSTRSIALGTSNIPFVNAYLNGNIQLGTATSAKIGFFGHAVASRQSVANSATVATLITALKAYGLIA